MDDLNKKPAFIFLFLLIAFGSITAVAFSPALPEISQYFQVSEKDAAWTVTLFLVGYALGQLIYGPIANRFGRKKAIYLGVIMEIVAAFLCILAGPLKAFWLLVLARLMMALGASVGLKMTFTLVGDTYSEEASRKVIAYLMVAFAITPAIGVAIGGFLAEHFGWESTFYFMAAYGVLLWVLTLRLPESSASLDPDALKVSKMIQKYGDTLKTPQLILGGLVMGFGTAYVYVFVTLAPFIGIQTIHLSPAQYGVWNLVPAIGVIAGSQLSAYLGKTWSFMKVIAWGVGVILLGTLMMLGAFLYGWVTDISLFLPTLLIYIGMSLTYPNASSLALSKHPDKSNGSAMVGFINVALPTVSVLLLNFVHGAYFVMALPIAYMILWVLVLFSVLLLGRMR